MTSEFLITKENGRKHPYEPKRVYQSIAFAMLEVKNRTTRPPIPRDMNAVPKSICEDAQEAAEVVKKKLIAMKIDEIAHERVHQIVEATLLEMFPEAGEAYSGYRQTRKKARQILVETSPKTIIQPDGREEPFDIKEVERLLSNAVVGLKGHDVNLIYQHACKHMQNQQIHSHQVPLFLTKAATEFISQDSDYDYLAARLKIAAMTLEALIELQNLEILPSLHAQEIRKASAYPAPYKGFGILEKTLRAGVKQGLVNPKLIDPEIFDLQKLEDALKPEGDARLNYQGVDTIYKRYVLKSKRNVRYELPQIFFMRVAMGLSLNEKDPTTQAIQFYEGYSDLAFLSSTPTLFNSGLRHSQLASCYLQTVGDDLQQIFNSYTDHALMAKFAGGIATDWSPVRGRGALIQGTNGESNGLVSWLKLAELTTKGVNQGGKRKGACAAYLQNWHVDFLEFMQMRNPQGGEELRIEQMNTVAWISDLYMKREEAKEMWTMFSPEKTPDLVDLYGKAFEQRYIQYETQALADDQWDDTEFTFNNSMRAKGRISKQGHPLHPCAQINAYDLFKIHISYLVGGGHPWITFKDPANICSPQDHIGVVHSSNLCTEITLVTKATTYQAKNSDLVEERGETAVCNLASLNLPHYLVRDENNKAIGINLPLMHEKVAILLRGLDNVIDLNYYPIEETRASNMRHRPVGLGVMGWHHFLQELDIPYDSEEAVELADHLHEHILYATLEASVALAKEKGPYESFPGSKWSKGILPQDSRKLMLEDRSEKYCDFHFGGVIPEEKWEKLRQDIMKYGVRNSNHIAIAPTATIGKIAGGTSPGVDPIPENIYSETDMGGSYTRINPILIRKLKELNVWNKDTAKMLRDKIVANNGSVQNIPEIPEQTQRVYKGSMDIDPNFTIRQAARRQKWIDQTASTNLYLDMSNTALFNGKNPGTFLMNIYRRAWKEGCKTTYYLITKSASGKEKTTISQSREETNAGVIGNRKTPVAKNPDPIQNTDEKKDQSPEIQFPGQQEPLACSIDNPSCEACQ